MKRCAVYVRMSKDRHGAGLGVQRQEDDCRAYATRMGWEVGEVYVDNDMSATSRKPRPAYQRLLADVAAGKVGALVVWHIDRLTRQVRELEDVIDLADRHSMALGTVTGDVDLATPTGRMVARIIGSTARYEAEHKGERQRRGYGQAAEAGKPHTGGRRPFGYLPDRVTVHPTEGPLVADAARRVLAGETTRSIVLEWNKAGHTHTTGAPWTVQALTTVLRSARISGRREVRNGATSKQLGTVVAVGCWDQIVTPDESDRLRAYLTSAERRAPARSQRARYLLSGLLTCGHCDTRLVALNWKAGGKAVYRCPSPGIATTASCGRLSVMQHLAEGTVRDVLLTALDSPEFHHRLAQAQEVDPLLAQAVARDEQKLVDLAADYADDALTRAEWVTARDRVKPRLAENKARLARATSTTALHTLDGEGALAERWAGLNLSQQRAVLAEVFTEVRVLPAQRRGQKWDVKRLDPQFRF